MYSKIVNPLTGRRISIKSRLGKKILRNYLFVLTGGSAQRAALIEAARLRRERKARKKALAAKKALHTTKVSTVVEDAIADEPATDTLSHDELRHQQDLAYEESLSIDRAKEAAKRQKEADEEAKEKRMSEEGKRKIREMRLRRFGSEDINALIRELEEHYEREETEEEEEEVELGFSDSDDSDEEEDDDEDDADDDEN